MRGAYLQAVIVDRMKTREVKIILYLLRRGCLLQASQTRLIHASVEKYITTGFFH